MLVVNEIFVSIQGEGTRAGELCAFIRLSGCSYGCYYCDTPYAASKEGGKRYSVEDVVSIVEGLGTDLVLITGGEPLEQIYTPRLAAKLQDLGYEVLVETNGCENISTLPDGVIKIVDVKLPWVGDGGRQVSPKDMRSVGRPVGFNKKFYYNNLMYLSFDDELKFVIDGIDGYNWAKSFIKENTIPCKIIFSPCFGQLDAAVLAAWIIKDKLNVRLGLQLHKIIWGDKSGV